MAAAQSSAARPAARGIASHARGVLVLGLPLAGSHLAQIALHITDTLMLGWYSIEALAALVLGSTLFFMLFIMGSGFAWAVMPMVAHAAGSGDDTEVRRVTRMGLWLSTAFSVACLPAMWWSEPILLALGQDPAISALAQEYLRIAGFGMLPALLVMVLKSYLAALERTQVVLWVMVAGAVLNVGINWVLIFGNLGAPEMGVRGAAVASVVVATLTFAGLVAYAGLVAALREHRLFSRLWRADGAALARVFRLGWPIGLTSLAETGLFGASSILMGWIGTLELAAHGIALQIISVLFMVQLGLSNAATVRAGRAMGAADGVALRRGAVAAMAISMLFALVTVAVCLLLPVPLIGIFLAPDDPVRPVVVAVGVGLLAVAALFQLFDAAQVMAMGLLRGMQDTAVPLIYAAFSYWGVGVPLSWFLGIRLGLGGQGVWAGLVVGLVLAALALSLRFWRRAARA